MKSQELKVSRIGNSRGIRLPAETLKRYGIGSGLIMEERLEGILLKPLASSGGTLSLEESAREMASASEDWDQWDGVAFDGLDGLPWQAEDAAEPSPGYAEGARNAGESRKG
ncbi:MAG: AbrB/MazE/SpoVT family DNA-binding domain-containing protein [Spirochaetota bacterium]